MRALTKEMQAAITPELAIEILEKGNKRFISNLKVNRDLLQQVNETSDGQHPFAVVLSCIDSRTSAELIFDQGLGDIFSVRIAGNIINEDILGSMEFSCKVAGAKIIVVLGHTRCGAIKGACEGVKLGNLTSLLSKIKPAIDAVKNKNSNIDENPREFIENVAALNVELAIQQIQRDSSTLNKMIEDGEIAIIGGIYDVKSGKADLFNHLPDSKLIEYYKGQGGI